jgi:hypothetical protein
MKMYAGVKATKGKKKRARKGVVWAALTDVGENGSSQPGGNRSTH